MIDGSSHETEHHVERFNHDARLADLAGRLSHLVVTHYSVVPWLVGALIAMGAVLVAVNSGSAQSQGKTAGKVVPLHAPDEKTIPEGPVGSAILYGKKVLTETQTYARAYVGNGLNCSSCHLEAGRRAYASPWVGVWGVFPEYRSRNGQVNALQDRVNDCFERSMNGKPLPYNSDEMRGILAYIRWLSKDVPTGAAVRGRGFARVPMNRPARSEARRSGLREDVRCMPRSGRPGAHRYYAVEELLRVQRRLKT